jgi:hypothetical protein
MVIPTAKSAYLQAYPWLGFDGHWGEEHEGFYNGPNRADHEAAMDAADHLGEQRVRSISSTASSTNQAR